jgi:hypothetical protein
VPIFLGFAHFRVSPSSIYHKQTIVGPPFVPLLNIKVPGETMNTPSSTTGGDTRDVVSFFSEPVFVSIVHESEWMHGVKKHLQVLAFF